MVLKAYVEAIPITVPNRGYEFTVRIRTSSIFDDTSNEASVQD